MKEVIISNGALMFRKYILDLKRMNKQTGIYRKLRKQGDWSKPYYYQKRKRPDYEIEALILAGKDPKANATNYKDVYLGPEKPEGFLEDEFTLMKEEGKVEFIGKDLKCTNEVMETLRTIAPDYFSEDNVNIYFLK